MLQYNERTGLEKEVSFTDADNLPTLPGSVHWNLYCETTRTVLQGDTAVSVTATVGADGVTRYTSRFDIPGSLNAIQNDRNRRELKKLLVIANKGEDEEFSEEMQYYVVNLRGRS
jgi:hypothetical protein